MDLPTLERAIVEFLLNTRNGQRVALILGAFIVYLLLIVAFAIIYSRRHKQNPSSFVFAKDILETQRLQRIREAEIELNKLREASQMLPLVAERAATVA